MGAIEKLVDYINGMGISIPAMGGNRKTEITSPCGIYINPRNGGQ